MQIISLVLFIVCALLAYTSAKTIKGKKQSLSIERNYYLKHFGYHERYDAAKRDYTESILGTLFFASLAVFFFIIFLSSFK